MNRNIKVLIAEDSPVVQLLLRHILTADPEITVMGCVSDGLQAIQHVHDRKPDILLMDVNMPNMGGLDATRIIMQTTPLPIIICSASNKSEEWDIAFRSLEAGAIASIRKPEGAGESTFSETANKIVATIKSLYTASRPWSQGNPYRSDISVNPGNFENINLRLVVIGASTGGPSIIKTILMNLKRPFMMPIVVVQHIPEGFIGGMSEWLRAATHRQVEIAANGARLLPSVTYLAPDGHHLTLSADLRVSLQDGSPDHGCKPSISHLFESVANTCADSTAAVLLSGMGSDGALELKLLRERGAATIVQDRETSVVYGMPSEALLLDPNHLILAPTEIATFLSTRSEPKAS